MNEAPKSNLWSAGTSGNPAGRPPGRRHRSTELLEKLMVGDAAAVVGVVVERALGGDLGAAKLILDRLFPAPRDRRVVLDLPDSNTAAGVALAQSVVVGAVCAGELRASEGQAIADLLELRRRAIETSDLEARLQALEGNL